MTKKRLKSNWSLLSDAMKNRNSKRFDAVLAICDDKEFAKNYIKMLEYIVPKPKRIEYHDENEKIEVVKVVHVYPK